MPVMEELLKIMSEIRPDIDFSTATQLIDNEILDSFDIVSMVSEINDAFAIEINVNDLLPENFNSAEALYALIQKLQNS
jgi:acyl carrier protein